MHIVCPACAAAYEVPLSLLKPGQAVRCARCAHEWVPSPAMPVPPAEVPATAEPAATPPAEAETVRPAPPPAEPPAARRITALRLAWVGSIVALVLLGSLAYVERGSIMQAWPPSIRLYAALGLAGQR